VERTSPGLPLAEGDRGEGVADLQRRLAAITTGLVVDGTFGPKTTETVFIFQKQRGLRATGTCDTATWMALVEAGYGLGDRLLYHTQPMIRGDDVAELQNRLGGLGFDAGRVDGIFGPDTAGALLEFQRHSGLAADGVTGPETLDQLARLRGRITEPATVAGVRERQRLRDAPRELRDRMLVVAHHGGMDALAQALARDLTRTGARAVVLQHHDPSTLAEQANALAAEVLIALEVDDTSSWCAYYHSGGFESPGGRRLADLVVDELAGCGVDTPATQGMRLPVLRETRMPAVVIHLGPASVAVTHTAEIARATSSAIVAWVASPVAPDD